jgi:hypothetical protein
MKCVADFDFQIRAAIHFPFVKTEEILGIYLVDQPHKLSANGLQGMETNIIGLRYGIYERLNLLDLKRSQKKYRQHQLLFFDEWYDFTEQSPFNSVYKVKGLIIAVFHSALRLLKQIVKKYLLKK